MEMQPNYLYVLFSRQNTKIGRVIRVFLRNSRYTHVALALDEKLYTVYSFSRARHDSPFSGGFVREYPVHYIIGEKDVPIKICRVQLTAEEYAAAKSRLEDSIIRREKLIYNLFDALVLPFGRRYRLKDAYTCVSFTAYAIGMDETKNIGDLENRLSAGVIYEGGLKQLIQKYSLTPPENDTYYERRGIFAATRDFGRLFGRLWQRRRLRIGTI